MGQEQSDRLNNFFSPRNIAVIGASTKNHWFANIVTNARRIGFLGHSTR